MAKVSGLIHKCKCNSVWCAQCFKQRHIDKYMDYLKGFRWTHTREMVLTVDPKKLDEKTGEKKFPNGEAAYRYVTENKKIPGLIRNIERGKKIQNPVTGEWEILFHPLKVYKWTWFLEWHKNGFPHWHVFLEVQHEGERGQVGVERIRHYWKTDIGEIHETYIKDIEHFRNITGYFQKHGYFEHKKNKKNHQMDLPAWGRDKYGAFKNIRRSAHKAREKGGYWAPVWVTGSERAGSSIDDTIRHFSEYYKRKGKEREKVIYRAGWYGSGRSGGLVFCSAEDEIFLDVKVDTGTGEIISTRPIERDNTRSYRAMMKDCGQRTKVNLYSEDTTAIGIFEVPYREVRQRIEGTYQDGIGYTFRLSKVDFEWLFSFPHHIETYEHSKISLKILRDQTEAKRKRLLREGGINAYYRKYA